MRIIKPKIEIPESAVLFFSAILNMQKPILLSVLVRNVDDTFDSQLVRLPISSDGKIDFAFMTSIVTDLEEDRIERLSTYLVENGLDNVELCELDYLALEKLQKIEWKEYRLP